MAIETVKTATLDALNVKLTELCKLQAQADKLKSEIEPFLNEGETIACSLGKLTKSKSGETFAWNTVGKNMYEGFKLQALEKGWGKMSKSAPSLRLTLTK